MAGGSVVGDVTLMGFASLRANGSGATLVLRVTLACDQILDAGKQHVNGCVNLAVLFVDSCAAAGHYVGILLTHVNPP